MPSFKEDIKEFMKLPYEQVISSIPDNGSIKDYRNDLWVKTFPWGVKKDNIFDFYSSDQYAASLFKEAVDILEAQTHTMTQLLADIVVKYEVVELPNGIITDPRILYYGCGNAMMLFELIGMNKWKITLADAGSAYFEFLKFLSSKYAQLNGLKFLEINKDNEFPVQGDRKYDIIIVDRVLEHAFDPVKTLQYLCSHLEDMGNIYITSNFVEDQPDNDPSNISLLQDTPQQREKWNNIIEDCGLKKSSEDKITKSIVWQKVAPMINKVSSPIKENRIFPTAISFLATLPDEQCGISTYTNYLCQEISKKYPASIFRDMECNVPDNSAIVAQIEFGIFPPEDDKYKRMLLSKKYTDNWKFAVWHTVVRDPTSTVIRYIQDIDWEYDMHIVHTVMQKVWLSTFVTKPIDIIPHGTLLWEPLEKEAARNRLKEQGYEFSKDNNNKIMFAFGFAAENKGLGQLIEVAKKVKIQNFKLVISAAPHGVAKEFTQKIIQDLRKRADTSNVIILGKHLTEEDINIWASAADILVFNYTTPPYIASPSGAMKRILAAGKPIICADDNRLGDLVNGQHALKYAIGNTPELITCIETLLSDREMATKLGRNCRLLAEQTSWEKTADKYTEFISKLAGTIGPEYYDQEYFVGAKGGKKFIDSSGEARKWSYYNETGEWLGAEPIMKAIKTVLNPKNMLSVGEGRGTFVSYARDAGIDAIGQDFSKWAVDHPYPRAKGLVTLGDVRDIQFPDCVFSLVFCSDIMEHVYLEDLPKAISEIQRVSNKWIFYNIGVSMPDDDGTKNDDDMVLQKNKLPPKDRQVTAVAGHVTVKPESWWREKLSNEKWRLSDDLVTKFRELVSKEALENWRCVLITERVD
jgi:glycosyltransferase involved in cell wall biosynthesis